MALAHLPLLVREGCEGNQSCGGPEGLHDLLPVDGGQLELFGHPVDLGLREGPLGSFFHQDVHRLGVEGIPGPELIARFGTGRLGGQLVPVAAPELGVVGHDLFGLVIPDGLVQPPAQNLHRLVALGRVDRRGLAGQDRLGFGERLEGGQPFVPVGVDPFLGVGADGPRANRNSLGGGGRKPP